MNAGFLYRLLNPSSLRRQGSSFLRFITEYRKLDASLRWHDGIGEICLTPKTPTLTSSFQKRAYFAKQNVSPSSGIQLCQPRMWHQSWIPCRGQTFRARTRKARPLHGMTDIYFIAVVKDDCASAATGQVNAR